MKNSLGTLLVFTLVLTSCTRDMKRSHIRIQLNGTEAGRLATIPAGYKVCYGVNVTAADISSTGRACGAPLGAFAGFVEANGSLEVSVPRGGDRKVDLYAYLTPNSALACPALDASCDSSRNCSTYKVATATGVSMSADVVELTMTVDFPGVGQNSVVQETPSSLLCAGSVASGLRHDGTIVDASLAVIPSTPSTPAAFTFYRRINSSTYQVVTRSATSTESASLTVKPQIQSLSVEKSGGQLYGVLVDGTIVEVDATGDYASPTTCPFVTCTIPQWFKTFALGPGQQVFGLDHGGGLWRMDTATTATQVATFPPYVRQVLFQ